MKQLFGFIILITTLFGCQKPAPEVIVKTITIYRDTCNLDSEFIAKICQIESGCKDSISGENGRGKGRFGIYEIAVKGSGLMDLLGYTHNDMFDEQKSNHVFWAMMGIFLHQYWHKHGKPAKYEDLARMWSGGPDGYKKKATLKYLQKFRTLK